MYFQILRPPSPLDPRRNVYASMDTFQIMCPLLREVPTEEQACYVARGIYPDAVILDVPIVIGTRTRWMLGAVDAPADQIDPDVVVPFSLFVHAVAETDHDRHRIIAHTQFDRAKWKSYPTCTVSSDDIAAAGSSYDPYPR